MTNPYRNSPLSNSEAKYRNDTAFKIIVDSLQHAIEGLHLTPSEVREAAMYACVLVEQRRVPKHIWLDDDLDGGFGE